MPYSHPPLEIGLSPRFLYNSPLEPGFSGKTLQYLEQSIAHWVMSHGALIFMLPSIEPGSLLERWFAGQHSGLTNSIHHRALRDLGAGLVVEARGGADSVIEAMRWDGARFVYGLQWHPEFHSGRERLLDCSVILEAFLREARRRKSAV